MKHDKLPWFPIYVNDFLTDERWALAEPAVRGAYIQLLFYQWVEGSIPTDEAALAKLTGLDEEWPLFASQVLAFFRNRGHGRMTNDKLARVKAQQCERAKTLSDAGKRGRAKQIKQTTSRARPEPGQDQARAFLESDTDIDTEEEKRESLAVARLSTDYTPLDLAMDWNTWAINMPQCREVTPKRQRIAAQRLREHPEQNYWIDVIRKIINSPFCCGQNDRGWRASFDFLIRPDTHISALEGKYDGKANGKSHARTLTNIEAVKEWVKS